MAYKEPESGEWRYLTGEDLEEANAIFEKVERWLDAGVSLSRGREPEQSSERHDVAALGNRLLERMEDDGVRRRTLEDWARIVRCHIVPVMGARSVVEWDGDDCQRVLRQARNRGLAPASVQDIGTVMVALVREAHRRPRWLPVEDDPMEGVRYRAKARHQGQTASFVPPSERPTTPAVRGLCASLWWRGRQDRWWYSLMGLVAGFTGLRWSELVGLRPSDYDNSRRTLIIATSIEQPDQGMQVRERTKNDKVREVPVTGTIHRWLTRRCGEVLEKPEGGGLWPTGGRDGLLFPGPDEGPWRRSTWRRGVFLPAARSAGWEMTGDKETASGLMRGGKARLPWRNLRHHAATWLHHEAGLPWEEVSHILGHHNVAFTISTYVRRGADTEDAVRSRLERF